MHKFDGVLDKYVASNHILSDKPIRSNALAYKWLQ